MIHFWYYLILTMGKIPLLGKFWLHRIAIILKMKQKISAQKKLQKSKTAVFWGSKEIGNHNTSYICSYDLSSQLLKIEYFKLLNNVVSDSHAVPEFKDTFFFFFEW